jgi:dipeptidyl aminopeptidase/acylaminoacyl peptidase
MSQSVPSVAPYGSWTSPVSAASLVADAVTLAEPRTDGPDLYWLEGRPSDSGRVVVVRRTADGQTQDVTRAPFNVRSRVHEYGGGAYDVSGGVLVFCNFDDRRVYRLDLTTDNAAEPRPVTPEGPLRYGDLKITPNGASLLAVCEDHGTGGEPANRLVRLDLAGDNLDGGSVLVEGPDFVSSAALSPDGARLAWLQWDHPNMPWDGCELQVADLAADGSLDHRRVVAGGSGESPTQPRWAPDGRLVFLSDRSGWWNLYACDVTDGSADPAALWPSNHEFADPQWLLGTSSYGITHDGTLLCTWLDEGYARLGTVSLGSGERREIDSEATLVSEVQVSGRAGYLVVGYADRPAALVRLDVTLPGALSVMRESAPGSLDPSYVSLPEPVSWRSADGAEVYGFYRRPHHPGFRGPDGESPPLVVMSHGGPTGRSAPVFDLALEFWTSRGIGVLSVNYRGSSGYGRAYREALRGCWGVVDVDDCATGAVAMASLGRADPQRLAIRGGSAGGYTTLAALTFRDVFTAGASLFGIGDLEALVRDTHKFESRYGDGLIGPYPQERDLYIERSPIHHVDQISCPMILLQGRDDPVVPLNQAESMAEALRQRGLPVALVVFDGEGHGFRRAENIIAAFEAEAYFYSRVYDFDLADPVEPIPFS